MNPLAALVLWVPLALAALVTARVRTPRVARTIGIAASTLVMFETLAIVGIKMTGALLRVRLGRLADWTGADGVTAAIIPVVAAVSLATLVSAPRADLDPRATASVLFAEATALGGSVTSEVGIFSAFVLASLVPLAFEAHRRRERALRRAVGLLVVTSGLPLTVAAGATMWLAWRAGLSPPFAVDAVARSSALGSHGGWIGLLFVVAFAARMGVFPLHLWIAPVAARARPMIALPTIVTPLGCIGMVRIVPALCPHTLEHASSLVLSFAAASAAYGAILALGQHHAPKQLGYFWVSLSGTIMAGLVSLDERGETGALLHQLAVVLSMTGLWIHLIAVGARAGTLDLRRLGGIVRRAPGLATGHLLLGLGTVAFPGSATFLSEDLVVQGLLRAHPAAAATLLIATAVNGLVLVRTFKRIFLGPPSVHAPDLSRVEDVQPRERWTAVALFSALLLGGLAPTPLLLLRAGIREPMDRSRSAILTGPDRAPPTTPDPTRASP